MCELNIWFNFWMLQRWRDWGRQWVFSRPCNHFSTLRVLYMTFLLFEILCRKVKRLDQSQDYFHLVPKRFLEVGGNRVFGQSSKNLFEPFLCSSSSYSYFVSKRVLLYQSECVRVFPFSIVSKIFQHIWEDFFSSH